MELRKCAAGEARDHFAEIISEAAYGSTRTVLTKHRKPVAAVIPIADLELLQELERIIDVEEAKKALAAIEKEGAHTLDELIAELEL